ncbi:hypothetical protein [Micromonospora sp. NPDC047074]|uniref:hypothetical protein n=1 Tax=Micromonospora sp. NPDC047074 TaxID=3154339 RepID=UPI0034024D20
MTEAARKVARQTEDRLDAVAKNVREKFARVTGDSFTDKIKSGRFADQADQRVDRGRDEARRREQGGSAR